MPDLTVSAGLARGLIDLAQAKGASRQALAERSGINLEELEDQDNRIPFAKYVTLMRTAKELTGDPALALHYGETNDLAEISVVGLLGLASETMMHALAQLNRYGRLVIEFDGGRDRFDVTHDARGLWIVDTRVNPNAFPELTESTFARMICGPRQFGVTQVATEVHVTHKDPGYRAEYERIYGAPVVFESNRNAMLVDGKWMTYRIQRAPQYVFGVLSEHADKLMQSLKQSKSMRGRIEALLMPILHTGEANMGAIAGQVGLSRTTLARRLKEEDATFEKILDELRHKMALHYLSGRKVSVNQTAYLVGFSEPAAFSRAFKRWTGASPRKGMAAGDQA